jgi:hypothetical protein
MPSNFDVLRSKRPLRRALSRSATVNDARTLAARGAADKTRAPRDLQKHQPLCSDHATVESTRGGGKGGGGGRPAMKGSAAMMSGEASRMAARRPQIFSDVGFGSNWRPGHPSGFCRRKKAGVILVLKRRRRWRTDPSACAACNCLGRCGARGERSPTCGCGWQRGCEKVPRGGGRTSSE